MVRFDNCHEPLPIEKNVFSKYFCKYWEKVKITCLQTQFFLTVAYEAIILKTSEFNFDKILCGH